MAIPDDRAPRKPDLETERPSVLAAIREARCLSGTVS